MAHLGLNAQQELVFNVYLEVKSLANNSTGFPKRTYDLPSHGLLSSLIVPDKNFLLVRRAQVHQKTVGYPY